MNVKSKAEKEGRSEHDTGLDVIRLVAFLTVPGVHFFLNSGFYDEPVNSAAMYGMTLVRTLCMVCVPLFLLLTGYLESRREIAITGRSLWGFYRKLVGVWVIYALAAVVKIIFRYIWMEPLGVRGSLSYLLSYQDYSWYVEMYLWLALMIPFLNLLWRAIPDRRGRQLLLLALLISVCVPGIVNGFGTKILPEWSDKVYPVFYYYLGAYLRETKDCRTFSLCHDMKAEPLRSETSSVIKAGELQNLKMDSDDADGRAKSCTWKYLLCFLGAALLNGICVIVMSRGGAVSMDAYWSEWYSLLNVVMAVLAFRWLHSVDYSGLSERWKRILKYLASLTYAAYLLSWIPDNLIYPWMNARLADMQERFLWYLPAVLSVAVVSVLLSVVITPIGHWAAEKICGQFEREWSKNK